MTKTNYLIAAAAHRAGRVLDYGCGIEGKEILRLHLQELAKTNTEQLAQVTIIRAEPLVRTHIDESNYYWDVSHLFADIKCPVQVIDVPDRHYSYSSWIEAAKRYQNSFDYYILCEDDYYPKHKDFANVLVDLHQGKLPKGGYLNGFETDHAAVSNGIVDATSFLRGISKCGDVMRVLSQGAQTYFSTALFDHRTDYTDEYRTLGWFGSGTLYDYIHDETLGPREDIFVPIQYLNCGENNIQKSLWVRTTP